MALQKKGLVQEKKKGRTTFYNLFCNDNKKNGMIQNKAKLFFSSQKHSHLKQKVTTLIRVHEVALVVKLGADREQVGNRRKRKDRVGYRRGATKKR